MEEGGAVGEGDELGKCVGAFRATEEGCVADLGLREVGAGEGGSEGGCGGREEGHCGRVRGAGTVDRRL